jgi:hypothetical protein
LQRAGAELDANRVGSASGSGVIWKGSVSCHPFEDQAECCELEASNEGECCSAEEGEHLRLPTKILRSVERTSSGVWQSRYMYMSRVYVFCTSGSVACFCTPARHSFPSQRAVVERPTSQPLLHMVRRRVRSEAHVRINTRSQRCTDDVHHVDNTCRGRCVGVGGVDSTWIR